MDSQIDIEYDDRLSGGWVFLQRAKQIQIL